MRLSELIPRDIISTLLHSNGARFWQKIPIRHVVTIKPGIFVFLLSLADAETPAEEKIFSVGD